MKKLFGILLVLVLFSSCDRNYQEKEKKIIYSGHRWDIIKMNDSIYVALPGLNGDKKSIPVIFNINKIEDNANIIIQ